MNFFNVLFLLLICHLHEFSITKNVIRKISSIPSTVTSIANSKITSLFSDDKNHFNKTIAKSENNKRYKTSHQSKDQFKESGNISTVCFGQLGCFGRSDFFHPIDRPINLLPYSPEEINTTFTLFTSKNLHDGQNLPYNMTRKQLFSTNFNPRKMNKFIVHGFSQEFKEDGWMANIKNRILLSKPDNYNVFCVDWSNGSKSMLYNQAVANTRVVGAVIAFFIERLLNITGALPENAHLIGHSLGGQIVGYAGKRFNGTRKIGRITALDPAGPSFQIDDPKARITRHDAMYVECVHTNGVSNIVKGYGLEDALADYDFYVNNGNTQPGCTAKETVQEKGIIDGINNLISCHHQRAYLISDIDFSKMEENCQYVGYNCSDYKSFEDGLCLDCGPNNENCSIYDLFDGESRHKLHFLRQIERGHKFPQGKYYFKTQPESPWCLFHYGIKIYIANLSDSSTGSLKIDFVGSHRSENDIELSRTFKKFTKGEPNSYLLIFEHNLGRIEEMTIKWSLSGISSLNPIKLLKPPGIKINKIETIFMSNIDPSIRKGYSSVLCPQETEDIKSGKSMKFRICSESRKKIKFNEKFGKNNNTQDSIYKTQMNKNSKH